VTPSLSSDVLLLALGPRATFRTSGPVGPVLAGALLCEVLLDGRPLPPSSAGGWSMTGITGEVQRLAETSVARCAEPLLVAGAIGPYDGRALGLFPRRGYQILDAAALSGASARLTAALTPGVPVTRGHAVLGQLCALSGIARHVLPPPRDPQERVALAHRRNYLATVAGPALQEVLVATRVLYAARPVSTAFVPVPSASPSGEAGAAGQHGGAGHHGHAGGHGGGHAGGHGGSSGGGGHGGH
jgi:uncharacterized membrane protein YgcG